MSAEITDEMTVKQLRESRSMSLEDLQSLLEASDKYLKFRSSSKKNTWMMVVIAKIVVTSSRGEKAEIKISTYHDVKEVKWNITEKQPQVIRKFLVMGKKMKEENYDSDMCGLRYWMIFEIIPEGGYTCSIEPVNNWQTVFRSCADNFKYQHIKEDKKTYGNLIIREEKPCMFQINYHIRYGQKGCKAVPVNEKNVPNGHEHYLGLQKMMEGLCHHFERWGVMEYSAFIEGMKQVYKEYKACELKRLDSFVF